MEFNGIFFGNLCAINSTTISVTFDNGVTENFTVEALTPDTDNERTITYLEKNYTVTVSDYAAPVATSISVDTVRIQDAASQALVYTVLDQYGEEMTVAANALTVTAYNVTSKASLATITDITNFDISGSTALDDVVRFTVYLTANPSVKIIKEVTVEPAAAAKTIQFGDFVLPQDEPRAKVNLANVKLNYTATDQFGSAIKLATDADLTDNNGVSAEGLIFSFQNISAATVNSDGEIVVTLGASTTTPAKITATNPETGEIVVSKSLTVNAVEAIDSVTLTKPETATYAVGDTAAKINIAAVDQYGTALTNTEIDTQKASIALSSSNQAVVANNDFTINADGTISVDLSGNTAGTTTIFAQVGTNITQFVMEVGEARRPNAMTVKTAPTARIMEGTNTTIQYELTDQYGAAWADADSDATKVNFSIVKVSGDDGGLTAPSGDQAAESNIVGDNVTIAAAAGKSGVYNVVAKLMSNDGATTYTTITTPIEVYANASTFTIAADKDSYTADENITVSITAKKADGSVYSGYTETGYATIALDSTAYTRQLTFVDGVATAVVPATVANADIDVRVTWAGNPYDIGADNTSGDIEVTHGEFAGITVAASTTIGKELTDIVIKAVDADGNQVSTYEGNKIATITALTSSADSTPVTLDQVDAENNIVVTFTGGITGDENINSAGLGSGNIITVTIDGKTSTVTE